MIYFLLFVILILMLSVLLLQQDILSPTFLTCGVVGLSVFVAALNVNKWGAYLHPMTLIVVIGGLLCFACGELLVGVLYQRQRKTLIGASTHQAPLRPIPINIPITVFVGTCITLLLVYSYFDTLGVAKKMGYSGAGNMLGYVRVAFTTNQFTTTKITVHGCHIAIASLLITTSIGLYNIMLCKSRIRTVFPLALIILPALGIEILTTNRTAFIENIAYAAILILLFIRYKDGVGLKFLFKAIGIAVVSLSAFFIIFIFLGYLGGRSTFSKMTELISLYTGFAIPSLDGLIRTGWEASPYYGYENFSGIYHFLFKLGIAPSDSVARYLPFYHIGETSGNIYTVFRKFIVDFGYVGMFIAMLLSGAFYNIFNINAKNSDRINWIYFAYSYVCYFLLMQGVESTLLPGLLATTTIYRGLYLVVIYAILIAVPRWVRNAKLKII